jgi:hypothetical protein
MGITCILPGQSAGAARPSPAAGAAEAATRAAHSITGAAQSIEEADVGDVAALLDRPPGEVERPEIEIWHRPSRIRIATWARLDDVPRAR